MTDVIKDGKGQALGTVKLDRRTDTVIVTPFDPSRGRPLVDLNGQPSRNVFCLDTAGNVVVNGDYSTIDNPNDPGNEFFGGSRLRQMFLPALGRNPNSPDTIDVFKNGHNGIGTLAITPDKTLQKVRISSSSPTRSRCGGREIPHVVLGSR